MAKSLLWTITQYLQHRSIGQVFTRKMALISSPTSLTTFSQPHASSSKNPHVSLNPVVGDKKSAIVAVQGDGVWTYDVGPNLVPNFSRDGLTFKIIADDTPSNYVLHCPSLDCFYHLTRQFWTTKTVSAPRANDQDEGDEGMDVDQNENWMDPKRYK